MFFFDWLSMYFWFFTLCFLYVPFGKEFSALVRKALGPFWSWDVSNDTFDLNEAFITPLVVTQLLNFLIETAVPYAMSRIVYNKRKRAAAAKLKAQLRTEMTNASISQSLSKRYAAALDPNYQDSVYTEASLTNINSPLLDVSVSVKDKKKKASLDAAQLANELTSVFRQHCPPTILTNKSSDLGEASDSDEEVSDDDEITRERADATAKAGLAEVKESSHSDTADPSLYQRRKQSKQDKQEEKSQSSRQAKEEKEKQRMARRKASITVAAVPSCGDKQQSYLDVVFKSDQSEYSTYHDYNDMLMQYGYVTMFSVVWPWIPLCALLNNMIEIRGDAFVCFYSHRRSVPRKATTIGKWENCIFFVNCASLVVNVGLICLSTGNLEWFLPYCHNTKTSRMGPDFECLKDNFGTRFAYGAVFEHVGVAIAFFIMSRISSRPSWVTDRMGNLRSAAAQQLAHKLS